MGMRVSDIHPAVVHAPLALLPVAATVDLWASARPLRSHLSGDLGRPLWLAASGSALFAGLAGLAASQEAKTPDREAERMMWLHGLGNFGLVLAATGVAIWRSTHRPTRALALAGLGAAAASMYTAYLGGEMVYGKGVGVRAMTEDAGIDERRSPPVLSWRAIPALFRDAWQGFGWLMRRTAEELRVARAHRKIHARERRHSLGA